MEFFDRESVRNTDHLEVVDGLSGSARIDLGNLVRHQQHGARGFEMPELHRDILRLDESAKTMQHLEALANFDDIAEVLERAGALAALAVHDVRRARGRREHHVSAPDGHVELGLRGTHDDFARRHLQTLLDQSAIESNGQCRLIDLCTAATVGLTGLGQQHPHALIFE